MPSWSTEGVGAVEAAAALLQSLRNRNRPSLEWATEDLARMARKLGMQQESDGLRGRRPIPLTWRQNEHSASDRYVGSSPFDRRDKLAPAGLAHELARLFSNIPSRRLVILGAPGSGKTTLAVSLVLQLLQERCLGDPVPILLSFADWDPDRQTYRQWLTQSLNVAYPKMRTILNTGRAAAEELMRKGKLVPVLDGLDEIPSERRFKIISSLNAELTSADPLVLTSRSTEYADITVSTGMVLKRAAVIEIQPLDMANVIRYISDAHLFTRGTSALREQLHDLDGQLRQALDSPLMLTMFLDVYADPEFDPADLQDVTKIMDPWLHSDYLLRRYIGRIASIRISQRRSWEPSKAVEWLSFIAQHMSRPGTSRLSWWDLDRSLPRTIQATVGAWTVGCISGLAVTLRHGILPGLATGLTLGATAAVLSIFIVSRDLDVSQVASYPVRRAGVALQALTLGLVAAAPLALVTYYFAGWQLGASVGFILGGDFSIATWFNIPSMRQSMGMPRSLSATRLFSFAAWAAIALPAVILWSLLAYRLHLDELTLGLIAAAATIPWLTAGSVWGRFTIARTWYAIRGKMPWRLMPFLKDMHRAGLLRRGEQSYEFAHASIGGVLRK